MLNYSLPVVAEPGFVVFAQINLNTAEIIDVFSSHPDSLYECADGVECFALNGSVTLSDYNEMKFKLASVINDAKDEYSEDEYSEDESEYVSLIEYVSEAVSAFIDSHDFTYDYSVGAEPAALIDEYSIVPSDGGTEFIDHGVVILNENTTDSEIDQLVDTHFSYLLDEVDRDSLYDYLVYQRDCAIENASED